MWGMGFTRRILSPGRRMYGTDLKVLVLSSAEENEVPDFKNGATESTKETEKKRVTSSTSGHSTHPLIRHPTPPPSQRRRAIGTVGSRPKAAGFVSD